MSDHRPSYLTREFAVYFSTSVGGFVFLGLLLIDSGLRAHWILGIGMIYGWFVNWLQELAQARIEERWGESSREEVSA